jgi:hypothetical protein
MMEKYIILEAASVAVLQALVNKKIQDGYRLAGNLVTCTLHGEVTLLQPMTYY